MTKTYICISAATAWCCFLSFYLAISGNVLASVLSLAFTVPAIISWVFFTALEFKE